MITAFGDVHWWVHVTAGGALYIATMPVRISISGTLASDGGRLARATVTSDQALPTSATASSLLSPES
jgi:hypothetical protein